MWEYSCDELYYHETDLIHQAYLQLMLVHGTFAVHRGRGHLTTHPAQVLVQLMVVTVQLMVMLMTVVIVALNVMAMVMIL